jgi:hypothetical protein
MPAEFEKRFKEITTDPTLEQKLAEIISEAGSEFHAYPAHRKTNATATNGLLNGSETTNNLPNLAYIP